MTFKEKYADFLSSRITYKFPNYEEAEEFFIEYMKNLDVTWRNPYVVAKKCYNLTKGAMSVECKTTLKPDGKFVYGLFTTATDDRTMIYTPRNHYEVELI